MNVQCRIPELKYDTVYKLKREERFSDLRFTINGGVETYEQIAHHLANGVDGVMLGRIATKGFSAASVAPSSPSRPTSPRSLRGSRVTSAWGTGTS